MKTEWIVAAALAFTAAGCARTPFPVIDAKLDELKGQPAQTVIDKLGDPSEKGEAGGEKTYVWALGKSGFAYGAVGFNCTITVFADKADNVKHYGYDGNVGGCGYYAHQLDDSYHFAQNVLD
jgi:hypothetical protein